MSKCGSYGKLEQDTHSIITATVDFKKGQMQDWILIAKSSYIRKKKAPCQMKRVVVSWETSWCDVFFEVCAQTRYPQILNNRHLTTFQNTKIHGKTNAVNSNVDREGRGGTPPAFALAAAALIFLVFWFFAMSGWTVLLQTLNNNVTWPFDLI